MAQMPIQLMSGRADPYAALRPAALTSQPKVAVPRSAYLYDAGGISSNALRPGAVDQQQFKAYLDAARKQAVLAPPVPAKAPVSAGIPSLSPAQLAALGAVEEPAGGELVIDIPAQNPAEPGHGVGTAPAQQQGGQAGGSGASPAPAPQATPQALGASPAPAAPGKTEAAPDSAPATAAPQASAEGGPMPGAHRGADGVWELPRLPDKDERDMLRGEQWRVVESEESRKLFLGPDGEFGWDDFLDVINPLQHIPIVNIAYRAITGDEIYGAARMVDFALGPLAAISTALDLAFRDITGKSMATNAVQALFGTDDKPAGDAASISTASGTPSHLAQAGLMRRGSNN
ncbi:MAG: hypothetical protein R3D05_06405 [Dongiaceae bacterium]